MFFPLKIYLETNLEVSGIPTGIPFKISGIPFVCQLFNLNQLVMNQKNLIILFYLNRAKTNQKGVCPIYCRLTYALKRKQFSTGQMISPANWNTKLQKSMVKGVSGDQVNLQLELIKNAIRKAYLQLQLVGCDFNVDEIFNAYLGKHSNRELGLIEYFKEFLNKKEKLIGKDLQLVTWRKYNYVFLQVSEFIKWKFHKNDILLEKLKLQFLDDFEYFLKTERNQVQVTINKSIQRLRKPVKIAVSEGYLEKDPFALHLPGRVIKEVVFLSSDELEKLEKHQFSQPRLELVKDLFIFCCYTGLAYREMSDLKKEHIVTGFDGNLWIQMKRQKTNRVISVPLLPKAKLIINKYDSDNEFVLPKFSNQKINSYLKEIAGVIGINKSISHHMARKTFASTVLLYNNVPIEIVSELLGHSSIKMTQDYYGKVVQKKVSTEINRLSSKC